MASKLLNKYLPAKALYLVIFISFVISVILLLLISNSYFNQIEVLRYQHLNKLIDANNNAVNQSLVSGFQKTLNESSGAHQIKTEVKQQRWGAYTIFSASSHWKDSHVEKTVLVGRYLFDNEVTGLYLADKGKYLSIAGDTKLSGETYLPALGIRSVYIDGVPYSGSSLVYGSEKTSEKQLPKVSNELFTWISSAFKGNYGETDSLGELSDLDYQEKISHSFRRKTLVFEKTDAIRLDNIELDGKIIIRSDSAITISKSLIARNIIAFAPIIIVEPGFSGSLQLIARDSLLIDKNVRLDYPSFAGVYNPEGTKTFLYLEENSKVEGGLLCAAGMGEGVDAEMVLKEGSLIHGIVYCSGSISHSGEVFGTMYLNKFVLKTPRGYYENHLLNAVVDPRVQTKEMVIPGIFENTEKGIVDELN